MSYHRDLSAELKAEVDLMNKLLLTLIDTDEFAKKVLESIEEEKDNSPENFVEYDEVSITESDIDRHIETVFQYQFDWEDNIPTIIYEVAHQKLDTKAIENMEMEIQEILRDQREYERDPLGYHGMSQRDFL